MGVTVIAWLLLLVVISSGVETKEEECEETSVDCPALLPGQYLCLDRDVDPLTQQLRGCHIVNGSGLASQRCDTIPGIVCQHTCNTTFYQQVPCKFTNGYNFDTALLLSVFLGMFGVDRFYLGYPAMGLLKFSTLGFFFIGHLVDIILIATQTLGPADGSHYVINYFGGGE